MPTEDEMSIDERQKYLRRVRERCWAADRAGRGELLTEMEAVTGLYCKIVVDNPAEVLTFSAPAVA